MYHPVDQPASVDAPVAAASSGAVPKKTSPKATKKVVKKLIKKAISDRDERCELMDAASEQKRFPETDRVLDYDDINLQSIFEYIQITRFEIDHFMLDKFWQSLREGTSVLMNGSVLEWLGYDHEQVYDRKAAFLKLLRSNDINFRQIKHNDPDFDQYPEFVAEAKTMSDRVLTRQQWIILDAQDFKRVVFNLRTKRAKQIHDYYLSLEHLMAMYTEYTYHFQLRKERRRTELEKDSLIKMMESLKLEAEQAKQEREQAAKRHDDLIRRYEDQAIKTDQVLENLDEARGERDAIAEQCEAITEQCEAITEQCEAIAQDLGAVREVAVPRTKWKGKQPMIGVFRKDPNYRLAPGEPRYMEHADVRIVRRQACAFNRTFKEFQDMGDGSNRGATVIHSLPSPNAINLFNRLKQEHPHAFIYHAPTGIQFTERNGPEELIDAINNLHEVRMMLPQKDQAKDV